MKDRYHGQSQKTDDTLGNDIEMSLAKEINVQNGGSQLCLHIMITWET